MDFSFLRWLNLPTPRFSDHLMDFSFLRWLNLPTPRMGFSSGIVSLSSGDFYWTMSAMGEVLLPGRHVSSDWGGLPGHLDAALTPSWAGGRTYFFKVSHPSWGLDILSQRARHSFPTWQLLDVCETGGVGVLCWLSIRRWARRQIIPKLFGIKLGLERWIEKKRFIVRIPGTRFWEFAPSQWCELTIRPLWLIVWWVRWIMGESLYRGHSEIIDTPFSERKGKIYSSTLDSIVLRFSLERMNPPWGCLSQDWKKGKDLTVERNLNESLTPWSTSLRIKNAIPCVLSLNFENRGE